MFTAVLYVVLVGHVVAVARLLANWRDVQREAGTFAGLALEIEALGGNDTSKEMTVQDDWTCVRLVA